MNHYKTSKGERISKSVIDNKIRQAKKEMLEEFIEEHGYVFCVICKRSNKRIDCSHIVSVNECQKSGRSELAYDKTNIEPLCRDCHLERD